MYIKLRRAERGSFKKWHSFNTVSNSSYFARSIEFFALDLFYTVRFLVSCSLNFTSLLHFPSFIVSNLVKLKKCLNLSFPPLGKQYYYKFLSLLLLVIFCLSTVVGTVSHSF